MKMANLKLHFAILSLYLQYVFAFETFNFTIRMPHIHPDKEDVYLQTMKMLELPTLNETYYIVAFYPLADMSIAHHMRVGGCKKAIEKASGEAYCQANDQLFYVWARNAPPLLLPQGVGFKVGPNSTVNYILLQVHYASIANISEADGDVTGAILTITNIPQPRRAGVIIDLTGGCIKPNTTECFDTACEYTDAIQIHPFAYRTHTHKRGLLVSGYKVEVNNGFQDWQLIGEKNPQLPQFFYPVDNTSLIIKQGNYLTARCIMHNNENRTICTGSTHNDEMCNFYIMYYVEGDVLPEFSVCATSGPPSYSWYNDTKLSNIPKQTCSIDN